MVAPHPGQSLPHPAPPQTPKSPEDLLLLGARWVGRDYWCGLAESPASVVNPDLVQGNFIPAVAQVTPLTSSFSHD